MTKTTIKSVAVYLPEAVVYNHQIEKKISIDGTNVERSLLEKLFGSKTRRFAGTEMQVSDLACKAAKKIVQKQDVPIDLLIFAAASSDLIEPATANIVQAKLGLNCPVMDIKNACNSFVSAIHVASAFIESGVYHNVLIVCGEKLSEVINYNPRSNQHLMRCLAGYSLGDAGAAMLIGRNGSGGKIVYQKFNSWGEYWNLCTIEGGGSLAYRDYDKYFFECDTRHLRTAFFDKMALFVAQCLAEANWEIPQIDCVVSHQISKSTTVQMATYLKIPTDKFVTTFSRYGNTAAATIPLALHEAIAERKLKKGDKVMLLGLAAGISLSVQLIEWS